MLVGRVQEKHPVQGSESSLLPMVVSSAVAEARAALVRDPELVGPVLSPPLCPHTAVFLGSVFTCWVCTHPPSCVHTSAPQRPLLAEEAVHEGPHRGATFPPDPPILSLEATCPHPGVTVYPHLLPSLLPHNFDDKCPV